jgi:uncharacterized membrane protein YhaH (DUF805 family)
MSFGAAVKSGLQQVTTFSGRATRSEYWWFQLFGFLASLSIYIVLIISMAIARVVLPDIPGIFVAIVLFFGAVLLWARLFVSALAVFARRMHDTGRSGAWGLLGLVPFGFVVLLVYACMEGEGPNQYGPEVNPHWVGDPGRYAGPPQPPGQRNPLQTDPNVGQGLPVQRPEQGTPQPDQTYYG